MIRLFDCEVAQREKWRTRWDVLHFPCTRPVNGNHWRTGQWITNVGRLVRGSTKAKKTGLFELFTTSWTCRKMWLPNPFLGGRSRRSPSELILKASLMEVFNGVSSVLKSFWRHSHCSETKYVATTRLILHILVSYCRGFGCNSRLEQEKHVKNSTPLIFLTNKRDNCTPKCQKICLLDFITYWSFSTLFLTHQAKGNSSESELSSLHFGRCFKYLGVLLNTQSTSAPPFPSGYVHWTGQKQLVHKKKKKKYGIKVWAE